MKVLTAIVLGIILIVGLVLVLIQICKIILFFPTLVAAAIIGLIFYNLK